MNRLVRSADITRQRGDDYHLPEFEGGEGGT
ncbi:MAG: hypothetical protein JWL77_4656, partial [Chthonomonadaceae bacterium]|nr:hypothetical protein [Chthonomonadaceae bacterium]